MRINKRFEIDTLKKYLTNGARLEKNKSLDTWGTSGSGYIRREGFTLTTPDGTKHDIQIIFSSKGYGTITTDIRALNERYLEKYGQYDDDVDTWLKNNIDYLLEP